MRPVRWFLAIGAGAYAVILVATFPASLVTPRVEQHFEGLSLQAVSGSVLSGRAGRLVYRDLELGPVHWRFRPLALLTGRLGYHVELTRPASHGHADVGLMPGGGYYARDMELSLLPDPLLNLYFPVSVRTSGEISLSIDSFDMAGDFPRNVTGQVSWQDAVILEPLEMVLGHTLLVLESSGDELVGTIESSGDFRISGDVALAPGGVYRTRLELYPDAAASEATRALLEHTTLPQPGGGYLLETSGRW